MFVTCRIGEINENTDKSQWRQVTKDKNNDWSTKSRKLI